jgi:GNAT superfamily N-acetyltransferase
MGIADFMADYERSTERNPFASAERVWRAKAAFRLAAFDGRVAFSIRSLQRGCGYGSAALLWLCDLADKHGAILSGVIEPMGNLRPRLTAGQLRAWYRRNGFAVTRDDRICRVPMGMAESFHRVETLEARRTS